LLDSLLQEIQPCKPQNDIFTVMQFTEKQSAEEKFINGEVN